MTDLAAPIQRDTVITSTAEPTNAIPVAAPTEPSVAPVVESAPTSSAAAPAAAPTSSAPAGVTPMNYSEKNGTELEEKDWKAPFWGCLEDPMQFIIAWFCPCITYSRNQDMFHNKTSVSTVELTDQKCITYAALQCCGCGWVLGWAGRKEIRGEYRILGKDAEVMDLAAHFCCTPCALVQEEKEIVARNSK